MKIVMFFTLFTVWITANDSMELKPVDISVHLFNDSMRYSFDYTHENGKIYKLPPKISPVHLSGLALYFTMRPTLHDDGRIIYKSKKLSFKPQDLFEHKDLGISHMEFKLKCFPTPDLKNWEDALHTISRLGVDGEFLTQNTCSLGIDYDIKQIFVTYDQSYVCKK